MSQSAYGPNQVGSIRRVSWGAVFAGVVIVLVTQLTLSLLGVAFGAGSIDVNEQNPMSGLALSSGIWLVVSTLLALFAGGWIAARMSGAERGSSVLHGAVTWGLSSLAMAYLVTFATGSVLSGAAGIVGKTASIAGQGAGAIIPEVAKAVGAQVGNDGLSWAQVKKEASTLLQQTGKKSLQPREVARATDKTVASAKSAAGDAAETPEDAGDELSALWSEIEARGDKMISAADQEAIANVLVARTDLTKPEAMKTVAKWQKVISDGAEKFAEVKAKVEAKARELADKTATAVANAAMWGFFGLMVGLLAAIGGAFLGSPTPNKIGVRAERKADPLMAVSA